MKFLLLSYILTADAAKKKKERERKLIVLRCLILLFLKEQFFLLELPGIERMGNTNSLLVKVLGGIQAQTPETPQPV